MFYPGIAIGTIIGLQLIHNGISITKTMYNFGYTLIYGKSKSDNERIDELSTNIQHLSNQELEILKRITELSQQIKQLEKRI